MVAYVSSSGQLFYLGFESPTGLATDAAAITTVTDTLPTVSVNGTEVSLYGPVWEDTTHDMPCVCWQLLDGEGDQLQVTPGQTITYWIPFGVVTTDGLGPNGPVTNGPAANYTGQYPPGFNGCSSFTPNPKMKLGFSGWGVATTNGQTSPPKNLRLRFGQFSGGVYDDNSTLLYIPPNEYQYVEFWNGGNANQIDSLYMPVPEGVYSITFKDANALSATDHLKVWVSASTNTCSGADGSGGPATGSGTTYVRTVAADGVTVTVSYWLKYPSDPNYTYGYNISLYFYMQSLSGYITAAGEGQPVGSGPISDLFAFAPGDSTTSVYDQTSAPTSGSFPTTAPNTSGYSGMTPYTGPFPLPTGNDTSDPLALANYTKLILTAANGAGSWCVRQFIQEGVANWQVPADLPSVDMWSFQQPTARTVTITAVRPYNTNPANYPSPYDWPASTKIFHPLLGFDGNDPTVGSGAQGNYIDLTLHNSGTSPYAPGVEDMGAWGGYFLEAVCSAAHGFRGGDMVEFPNTYAGPVYVPTTGGPATPTIDAQTVTVTNGSPTITFASSQTLSAVTPLTFSADTTGQAYLASAGTGTSFTISPAYAGTSSSSGTATSSAAVSILGGLTPVYPTSSTSFVFFAGSAHGYDTGPIAMTGTSPVATTVAALQVSPYRSIPGGGPYEFMVHGCARSAPSRGSSRCPT